jgi:outer membrane protein assembly factor BamB
VRLPQLEEHNCGSARVEVVLRKPAIANGTVYVGSWDSKLYAFSASGSANCSTSATGKTCTPLWTAATLSGIGGTPAVVQGVVYTVSANGTLSAFSAAGSKNCTGTVTAKTCTPLWTSAPGESGYATSSSPAVANGVVYFSSTNGGTYGYDAAGSLNCSASGTAKTCSAIWGRHRLHRRRIACHRQRSPLHQRLW